MKSYFLVLLLGIIASGLARAENNSEPQFTLHRGDASKVTVEKLGPLSSGNARLFFVLTPQKAKEFSEFSHKVASDGLGLIVTDFQKGKVFTAYTYAVKQSGNDGSVFMCYSNAHLALDDARALLDDSEEK